MTALFNNNSFLPLLVIGIASLAGVGLLIYGIIRMTRRPGIVDQRMRIFVENRREDLQPKNSAYRFFPRELSGPFFNRTVKPFFQRIINFFGKSTPEKSIAKSDYDLRLAGNPFGMHAREFYGVRAILIFLGFGLAFLIYFRYGTSNIMLDILALLILLLTVIIPRQWLGSKIRQRKTELSVNLPDALDMLSVCAVAGLSFDLGLKKICEYWPTALTEEFKQVLQEMEMGVPRSEALQKLRTRVDVDDLSNFIAIMIQAEKIGMSYAEVLQSQAKQMRIIRQYRAREKANALPAKMLIPLALFIFPAILAVVLAPVLPIIMGGIGTF
jgi:tight adherence protein C